MMRRRCVGWVAAILASLPVAACNDYSNTIQTPTGSLLTFLAPADATAGGPAFTLTVNGTNFVATSVVNFNGAAKTTMFVNPMQLTASITAADIANGGLVNVTVRPDMFQRDHAVLVGTAVLEIDGILQARDGLSVRALAARPAPVEGVPIESRDFR